ncbi:MAG: RHS repeat protein [Novosphingobium sp.]|nr:RHS repeat protein [Burkholderiales bacterium]MCZ8321096.1 RHS repeat protein [Novosphingobium sp.]
MRRTCRERAHRATRPAAPRSCKARTPRPWRRRPAGTAHGKLVSITYPSANRINLAYDAAGRISSITLNPTVTVRSWPP